MATDKVKIRITRKELEVLKDGYYICLIGSIDSDNEHEVLLEEHGAKVCRQIDELLIKDSKKYFLHFDGTDALAFKQTWTSFAYPAGVFQSIILRIMAANDLVHVNAKRINQQPYLTIN